MNCDTLQRLIRERTRFVLRLPGSGAALAHRQVMRIQCGGVRALADEFGGGESPDVHRLVLAARERFPSLVDLPWQRLVESIAGWQPRRRGASGEGGGR